MNLKTRVKKLLPLLLTVVFVFGLMPVQAMADVAYDRPGKSMDDYQAIVDKLNEELGTEGYIIDQERVDQITTNLINSYGYLPFAPPRVVTLEKLQHYTLREFEAEFRANVMGYSILMPWSSSGQTAALSAFGTSGSSTSRTLYWAFFIKPNPYLESARIDATKNGYGNYTGCGDKMYFANPQMYDNGGIPCYYFSMSSAWVSSDYGYSTLQVTYKGLDVGFLITLVKTRECDFG